jgi:VWFA-related protein
VSLRRAPALLLVFPLAGVVAAPAAGAVPEPVPTFGEVVDVRVVNLEVVVTDADGKRVSGLGPSDLRLRVAGVDTPIEYWSEIRDGGAVTTPATADGTSAAPVVAAGTAVATSYLVFVDEVFAFERDRDRVLAELAADLPSLGPLDRMTIVAYDGDRLTRLSPWTGSATELAAAIAVAATRPVRSNRWLNARRAIETARALPPLPVPERSASGASLPPPPEREVLAKPLTPAERDQAERLTAALQASIHAAAATLGALRPPAGRGVVLLLAGGWPISPVDFVAGDPERPVLHEIDLPSGAKLLRPLIDAAQTTGYAIYGVDLSGRERPDMPDAGHYLMETEGPGRAAKQLYREGLGHDTLELVAAATGGRALLNEMRLQAFTATAADARSYYSLGFSAPRRGTGERVPVEITARRSGLRVRAREGFVDASPGHDLQLEMEGALLLGSAPPGGALEVTAERPRGARGGTMLVPLRVRVPVGAATFVPAGDHYVARLELRMAAADAAGRRPEIPPIQVEVSAAAPAPADHSAVYATTLLLRRRRHTLVLTLVDPPSGRLWSTTLTIEP